MILHQLQYLHVLYRHKPQTTYDMQQTTNHKKQTTNSKQQTTNHKPPPPPPTTTRTRTRTTTTTALPGTPSRKNNFILLRPSNPLQKRSAQQATAALCACYLLPNNPLPTIHYASTTYELQPITYYLLSSIANHLHLTYHQWCQPTVARNTGEQKPQKTQISVVNVDVFSNRIQYMGVSENVVYPIFPMVLLIIIPIKWLFVWEYTQHFQTNPYGTSTIYKWGITN